MPTGRVGTRVFSSGEARAQKGWARLYQGTHFLNESVLTLNDAIRGGIAQGLKSSIQILSFFRYAAPRARSEKTKWAVVMSEFAPICIYLVISPLVSLILLGVPFPFASNSSTYPEKLSAYECGFDPFGDARSRFDIRFYLVSILFIIPDPEVTFSFPWAVPPNKIDPFGSWSMMAFLLILTIGSLYEWKRGASDRE